MVERPNITLRSQYQRPHVLVISDDDSLTDFLQQGLPPGGFWVSVIASGVQAIEVFRLRQFDIVAVDAALGSFDWHELVRRLRGTSTRAPGAVRTQAPIVLVSESSMQTDEVDLVVSAPVELDDLVRMLHTLFERWQDAHPEVPLSDAVLDT